MNSRKEQKSLHLSGRDKRVKDAAAGTGRFILFAVTSISVLAVFFIFYFIGKDAIPFFKLEGFREFFTSTRWYPSADEPEYGVLAIIVGSALVTAGAILFAVPLGISAAVCLSDILPFNARQMIKPIIEVLAAIPSVAYGFFALVVFAPIFQSHGGVLLSVIWWLLALPVALILSLVISDVSLNSMREGKSKRALTAAFFLLLLSIAVYAIWHVSGIFFGLQVASGANALNASIMLGIMALPTIVSVSEDSLQAAGRELREASYALGATRAETMIMTIIPAASSGIGAAILLGIMRAIGETMVVWMASGNAAQIPHPWFDLLEPVRTLTATIAGDMGEADHVTGSSRYHVLFAMGLSLLLFSFLCNMVSENIIKRQRKKLRGE